MTLGFNAAFQSELNASNPSLRAATSPEDAAAFLAAIDGVLSIERKRRGSVSASAQQHGADMQKNKFLLEDGSKLKFPMDEDIMQALLETVKDKIAQLKQLRDELKLN